MSGIDILFLGFYLSGIWWLYSFVYRDFKIDESRQMLFKIRDDLFDKAAADIISFDDDAYGLTRNTLNGLIRFTHNLSTTRIIVMNWFCNDFDAAYIEKFSTKLDHAFDKLSPEQREIYQMAFVNAHWVILQHIAHTSPLLSLFFLPFRFVLFLFKMIRHFTNGYKNTLAHVYQLSAQKDFWKPIDARANFIAHCHPATSNKTLNLA